MHPAGVSQDLTVTAGANYKLTFRSYFDKCTGGEGFVGVRINQAAPYTVDACDHGAGVFTDNTVSFTAPSNPTTLRFEFLTQEPDAVIKIDNVVVVPA